LFRFYRRPDSPKAKLLAGIAPKAEPKAVLGTEQRKPGARARLRWARPLKAAVPAPAATPAAEGAAEAKAAEGEAQPAEPTAAPGQRRLPPGLVKPPGEPAVGHGEKPGAKLRREDDEDKAKRGLSLRRLEAPAALTQGKGAAAAVHPKKVPPGAVARDDKERGPAKAGKQRGDGPGADKRSEPSD
jgi:hypothetical protein